MDKSISMCMNMSKARNGFGILKTAGYHGGIKAWGGGVQKFARRADFVRCTQRGGGCSWVLVSTQPFTGQINPISWTVNSRPNEGHNMSPAPHPPPAI